MFLQDFTLCIWRVYDWQCVHILGGHKDTIHDFSIHPTGKMALSVSKDHTLKLWNLVQGTVLLLPLLCSVPREPLTQSPGDCSGASC
jgi:WD40 repeat protein